ncbi:MAG: hypothetical protein ABIH23_11170 [bacterium]
MPYKQKLFSVVANLLAIHIVINIFAEFNSAEPILSQETIGASEIRLGLLKSGGEIVYHPLRSSTPDEQVSIALYGHIYQHDEPQPTYLRSPLLILEKSSNEYPDGPWLEVERAFCAGPEIEVARIQNYCLDSSYRYRIGTTTSGSGGGRYALVIDPSRKGFEVEVEDLDFGVTPRGQRYSLSCAYVAADNTALFRAGIFVGTNEGTILESVDDAKTWSQIYPAAGGTPFYAPVFGVFVDSQGILYASPWTTEDSVNTLGVRGEVVESRDGGKTWQTALTFQWPTGVGWRMTEDREGNVFVGEYTALRILPVRPFPGVTEEIGFGGITCQTVEFYCSSICLMACI